MPYSLIVFESVIDAANSPLGMTGLTRWCFGIALTFVVWTCDIFENNCEIKHALEKYLRGSSKLVSDSHYPYFDNIEPNFASDDVVIAMCILYMLGSMANQ